MPNYLWIWIALSVVLSFGPLARHVIATSSFPDVEYSVLGDLYNSTNGAYWVWSSDDGIPWFFMEDANPCTDNWQGVTCTFDSTEYHVIALNLTKHGLYGPLTNTIGNLSQLVSLDLSANNLQSTIPSSITNLTKLQHLDLSDNRLFSTIPHTIGALRFLQYLDLHAAELYGSIPHSIGDLLRLQYLDLHFNGLTNTIPDNMCTLLQLQVLLLNQMFLSGSIPAAIGNLVQLHTLDLSFNELSGAIPNSIGQLTELRNLAFFDNFNMHSTIPGSIAFLTQLQNLAWDNIQLTGSIPDVFANLTQLQHLQLGYNSLTGLIPTSIFQLTQLQTLDLYGSKLVGSLSNSVGNLQELQYIDLSDNHLNGTIPASITTLGKLRMLDLSYNQFVGSIPQNMGALIELKILSIQNNNLTGSVPESVGQLDLLENIDLSSNSLNGSIPASVGLLSNVVAIAMSGNFLSGSLPPSVCNLIPLQVLFLFDNELTGHIPTCIGNLTVLTELYMYSNKLSGPIPDSIGGLSSLLLLYLYDNRLTGSLPASIVDVKYLLDMLLHHNQLDGPIPTVISNMSSLRHIQLNNNKFTGTIPYMGEGYRLNQLDLGNNYLVGDIAQTLSSQAELQVIYLDDNQLTGAFPVSWYELFFPEWISLANNHLSGPLPVSIDELYTINVLDLSYNHFSGPLPASLCNLSGLNVLSLQGNQLSGGLEGIFTANMFGLTTLQLDYNPLSGELPTSLFELPSIASLSIVGSCIYGTLPANICNATSLEALILYGLTTGDTCRAKGLAIETTSTSFGGALPACVLALPMLRTLLLAGNGFTGRMRADWPVNNKMIELDLSHNRLSGIIPDAVQNHTWLTLDLSHNKLRGVLQEGLFLAPNDSISERTIIENQIDNRELVGGAETLHRKLSLASNRLSGIVPNSIKSALELTVLAGNLFQCALNKQDLPPHDGGIDSYQCASNSFDVAIYVWLALCVGAALFSIVVMYRYAKFSDVLTWPKLLLPDNCTLSLTHLQAMIKVYQLVCRCSLLSACFVATILLPYYAVMSHYEGTHSYQYAFILSAIYTSGVAPFVLDCVLYAALLVAVYYYLTHHSVAEAETTGRHLYRSRRAQQAVWVSFATINVVVVLGVNIAFVYIVLYESSNAQTLAQVGMSIFKTVWNTGVAPRMIRRLDAYFVHAESDQAEQYFSLQLIVALFNNIAIPCLVVAAIDPNCFSDILLPPTAGTVYYFMPVCELENVGVVCGGYFEQSSLQYTPPFTYSYQCSASFITSYAPTFVYMSVSTMFLSPALQLCLVELHRRWGVHTVPHQLAECMLPLLLKPPQTVNNRVPGRRIVGAVSTLVTLLTHFGILLTFGVIFPPVAVAMAASMAAVVCMTQYKIQRFVDTVVKLGMCDYIWTIDQECVGVGRREHFRVAASVLVCIASTFYTLFLFDTLVDTQGYAASIWVLIVVPALPMALLGAVELYHMKSDAHTNKATIQEEGIELTEAPVDNLRRVHSVNTINVLHDSSA